LDLDRFRREAAHILHLGKADRTAGGSPRRLSDESSQILLTPDGKAAMVNDMSGVNLFDLDDLSRPAGKELAGEDVRVLAELISCQTFPPGQRTSTT